jgi:hypothetical protein
MKQNVKKFKILQRKTKILFKKGYEIKESLKMT